MEWYIVVRDTSAEGVREFVVQNDEHGRYWSTHEEPKLYDLQDALEAQQQMGGEVLQLGPIAAIIFQSMR